MDKLKGAVQKVQAANIIEKGSSTDAPSSVMVAVRCRPCALFAGKFKERVVDVPPASQPAHLLRKIAAPFVVPRSQHA